MLRWFRIVQLLALLAILVPSVPALAWKPYTHNVTAEDARADAADGYVEINGRQYAVRADVAAALRDWPAYYNAGVVGPDGYPDLTFGQSVIHPEEPGKWLRHIYEAAWAAQSDGRYTAAQKSQILAFAYGYMTHAAGDLWAHTLVNEYAEGVFPAVKEALTDSEKLEIALRHTIIEGYIGDATPGYDTNHDRTVTPFINKETGELDISDDSTPGRDFSVPNRFVYETLVDPNALTPVNVCGNGVDEDRDGIADDGCPGGPAAVNRSGSHDDGFNDGEHGSPVDGAEVKRGPLIDYFIAKKSDLQLARAEYRADRDHQDCANGLDPDCYSLPEERAACIEADPACANEPISVAVNTVRGIRRYTWDRNVCYGATIGCAPDPGDTISGAVDALIAEYLEEWIADIDTGLEQWPELGQAITEAMFDPQARRDAQNFECRNYGDDTTEAPEDNIRSKCEDGIGVVGVIMYKADPYITNHMMSMMGLPDLAGSTVELLNEVAEVLDDVLGPTANPLRMVKQEIREYAKRLIYAEVSDRFGIDIEAAQPFFTQTSTWFTSTEPITIKAKPVLDANGLPVWEKNAQGEWRPKLENITLNIFNNFQHERIDALLGLPADHHQAITEGRQPPSDFFPNGLPQATRLADHAKANPHNVAPMRNTIVTAKLLLLDAAELNRALSDELVAQGVVKSGVPITTYVNTASSPANMMIDGFNLASGQAGSASRGHTWLKSVDSDHAWRQDGLPVFCDAVPDVNGNWSCRETAYNPAKPNGLPALRFPLHGEYENGGHGNMPIWESCVLRPAFRGFYRDWENETLQFPDHGDLPSADAADPHAPTSTLVLSGNAKSINGTTYLGGNHSFTLSAQDAVFASSGIQMQYRIYKDGQTPSTWQSIANGGSFSIPANAGDGLWRVDYQSADPCHPFNGTGAMAAEQIKTATYYLDTTAPEVTFITPPKSPMATYLLNEVQPANYTCSDGTGSGVASCVGTVPVGTLISTTPVGVKTFTVTTADSLGNQASPSVTYNVTYKIGALYDQTKSHKLGSVVPIKLQLLDANNVNQSAPSIVVTASSLARKDNTASPTIVDDAGNANPDSNFRYDPTLGGYIYNLSTKTLSTGTWVLTFTASGDPVPHTVSFDVR